MTEARQLLEHYRANWSRVDEDCGPQCAPGAFFALEGIVDAHERHRESLPPKLMLRDTCTCHLCVCVREMTARLSHAAKTERGQM